MLTEKEAMDKLHDYAEQFDLSYRNKEWSRAKMLYFQAQTVAVFLELPEDKLAEFFGNRPYKEDWEPLEPGLFPEEKVERVSWECVRIHETYDELHLRPRDKGGYAFVADWKAVGHGIVQVKLEEVGT